MAGGMMVLEDGTVFPGVSVGAEDVGFGEAVFATSMTGYQETVTDPSYVEQIVCFTAPMIGNYGVDDGRLESSDVHVAGVVMREARGPAWTQWLRSAGVVALSGVDTRSLVLHLRRHGAMRAAVVSDGTSRDAALTATREQPRMAGRGLVSRVSPAAPYVHCASGAVRVAVVDYGVKRSILDTLARDGAAVTVYPHDVDAAELERYDGVVLSNGPGDPSTLRDEVGTVQDLLGKTSVLGICLGHQLLGLAAGLPSIKLPFGHRGANHPVLERATGRVLVTSQNHGFAIAPTDDGAVSHVSLYDGTVEGLEFPALRARSVQFHPEAGPGPHDARPLLARWVAELEHA
jgi:carbamoyl-phosphate synthase small subunit